MSQGSHPVTPFIPVRPPVVGLITPPLPQHLHRRLSFRRLLLVGAVPPAPLNSEPGNRQRFLLFPFVASSSLMWARRPFERRNSWVHTCEQLFWAEPMTVTLLHTHCSVQPKCCARIKDGPCTQSAADTQGGFGFEIWQTKSFHQWLVQIYFWYEFLASRTVTLGMGVQGHRWI